MSMSGISTIRCAVMALLLACCAAHAQGTASSGQADVATNPGQAWEDFLANAELGDVYPMYGVLDAVAGTAQGVDPEACKANADTLTAAVAAVPASIALHRAAMQCAQASDDQALADRELAALSALAKLALSQASDVDDARPIRILHPADAYALLRASGLELRYEYYAQFRADRYFPFVVAAWDPEAMQERHFRFDVVDALARINRKDRFSGFPYDRMLLADAFVKGQVQGNGLIGIDLQAVRAAAELSDPKAKLAKLRPAADKGGVLSTQAWVGLCALNAFPGCAQGLVDALLPQAEARHAMAMVQLAYLYDHGIGIKQDSTAADTLLAGANRIWPHDGATVQYAVTWSAFNKGPFPEALRQRLLAAQDHGNPNARAMLIERKLQAQDKPALLDAGDIDYLSSPLRNDTGGGYRQLALYYRGLKREQEESLWIKRAAESGDAYALSEVAYGLRQESTSDDDHAKGKQVMAEAAHAGNAWAQSYMALFARRDKRWGDAEKWLMSAVTGGDVEDVLSLASLYEWEREGVDGKVSDAVRIYKAVAKDPGKEGSEARRRLSYMALAGRGMDKDPAHAESWLRHDAEQGDHESESLLGMGYLRGQFGKVDEARGVAWMEKAVAGKQATAYLEYGSWLYYTKKGHEPRIRAVKLWQAGDKLGAASTSNNLAWALCTSSDEAIFDPKAGLDASSRIGKEDALDEAELDTVAACHAAAGEFDRAMELQEKAIAIVKKSDDAPKTALSGEDYDEGYAQRLALYAKHRRYVEPD